jgi:tetratricopeptide (TPR) repeat protein
VILPSPHQPSSRHLSLIVALIFLAAPPAARAQADAKAEARAHFENGVAAFNDRRFAEAAEEFEAAYRISPAFVVLYNVGQVNVALGRSVEAVEAFQKYLDQGARNVSPQRRREVEAELRKQEARIGVLVVTAKPEGADVRVDGKPVGKTPPARSVRVNAGRHTVEAAAVGYLSAAREITARGRESVEVSLELEPRVAVAQAPAPVGQVEKRVSSPPPVEAGTGSWRRTAGYVLGGVGVAALATGSIVALLSLDRASEARRRAQEAKTGAAWDTAAADLYAARDRNKLGWTIAGAGGALVIGGLVVALTGDSRPERVALTLTPAVGPRGGALMMAGGW